MRDEKDSAKSMTEVLKTASKKTETKKTETKKTETKKTEKKKAPLNLVIVESPAKAKTLKKFLGSSYKIDACMGHVRDLPKSELGIDKENGFEPKYITIRGKGELLSRLRKETKTAKKVFLATDPDREGEAIAWHLKHALKLPDENSCRITFNEITETAVKKSIKEARDIDMQLVDAQQARRALDRIVGYKISPLLWRKVRKGLSAGRVQSVALKIICDREEEVRNFQTKEYWTIQCELQKKDNLKSFAAKFYGTADTEIELNTEAEALAIVKESKKHDFIVSEVKKGKRVKKPLPPFTTSTLQQEASKALGFTATKTMQIAQVLYEGIDIKGVGLTGLVSYIRTDSMRISDEAYEGAKKYITEHFSDKYLPASRNEYKTKKRLQDAHEAIRPSDVYMTPVSIKESLTKDQYRLYTLIWERFLQSQMAPAEFDTVSVKIKCGNLSYRSSGSVVRFDGYQKVYKKEEQESDSGLMPPLTENELLTLITIDPLQHFTQPPPRFSEAVLVKTLEENGVGRPSTYAPIITTLTQRRYVVKENKVFFPTELGEIVNEIMANHFADIVDIDFTAKMEEELDSIEEGESGWKNVIGKFFLELEKEVALAEEAIGDVTIKDEETDVICENCGRNMVIKFGRFGKFLACPGYPECKNAKPFFEEAGVSCPLCHKKVLVKKSKKGRIYFGCEDNPACGFISWGKPTGELCPVCGEALVEKGKKKIVSCMNNQCTYTKDNVDAQS